MNEIVKMPSSFTFNYVNIKSFNRKRQMVSASLQ